MTTNQLATLQKGELKLSEIDQMILEEAAADEDAFDIIPTKITIAPGGINVFSTSDGEAMKTLTAIIAVSQKARAYWPEKGTGSPPLCASYDGRRGVFNTMATDAQCKAATGAREPHPAIPLLDANRPIPDAFPCATCPLSQWGSTHQNGVGKSKACKELRRLVIIVDGWTAPALLTLPPTSIRAFDAYASGLQQKRLSYFAVRTKITLEAKKTVNGEPYSVAAFAVDGKLADAEQVKAVIALRAEYKRLVGQMEIVGDEYDETDTTPPNGDGDAEPPIPF